MGSDSRVGGAGKATLEDLMRERIRATIEAIVDEELAAALSGRLAGSDYSTNGGGASDCIVNCSLVDG